MSISRVFNVEIIFSEPLPVRVAAFIVECEEDGCLYVDVTGFAMRENPDYENMEYIMDAACKEAHEAYLADLNE